MASAISTVATTKIRKTSTAPTVVAGLLREGDEAEVDAVEHQLHAHQHHQHVAADDDADQAEREQRHGDADEQLRPIHVAPDAGIAADPDHRQRSDHRRDEQHRRELEEQPVLAEEGDREAGDAERASSPISTVRRGQRPPDADHDHAEQQRPGRQHPGRAAAR